MCQEYLVLLHELQNSPQIRQSKSNEYKITNSQVISNIQKQIRNQQFLTGLLQPFHGFAWLTMIILMVVLLSWGIIKLRAGQNNTPATSIQSSQPTTISTQIFLGSQNCRNIVYTVEEKNTLLAISDFFNVALTDVWEKNMLGNDSVLKPGMSLIIPFCGWNPVINTFNLTGVTPIDNCPTVGYTIQQGETVEGISTFFIVPVTTIIAENHLVNNSILSPGNNLIIPLCKYP